MPSHSSAVMRRGGGSGRMPSRQMPLPDPNPIPGAVGDHDDIPAMRIRGRVEQEHVAGLNARMCLVLSTRSELCTDMDLVAARQERPRGNLQQTLSCLLAFA